MTYSVLKKRPHGIRNFVIMLSTHGFTVRTTSDAKDRISMRDSIY